MQDKSKSLAGIMGPTLVVMVTSELRLWNPTLYDEQITPLVYLSGVLFFVAGVAIVKVHNVWIRSWQTSVTVIGWLAIFLGTMRMLFPEVNKTQFKNNNVILAIEILLILYGIFLSFKAYWPGNIKN